MAYLLFFGLRLFRKKRVGWSGEGFNVFFGVNRRVFLVDFANSLIDVTLKILGQFGGRRRLNV